MRVNSPTSTLRRSSLWGAAVCLALSWLINFFPRIAEPWANLSYDTSYLFKDEPPPEELIVIFIDEKSYGDLKQSPGQLFDRGLYAPVLRHLTRAGARLVMIDTWFDPSVQQQSDAVLAEAIRENGRVVLVNEKDTSERREIQETYHRPPPALFLQAGATNGNSVLVMCSRRIPRQYDNGSGEHPGFAWVGAQRVNAPITQGRAEPDNSIFLRYYVPPQMLRSMSFSDVTHQPASLFTNKYVFIGSLPTILPAQEVTDQFRAPFMRAEQKPLPGVEIAATAFLNLVRGDGLYRMRPATELAILGGVAVLIGGGLVWLRPWWAAGVAMVAVMGFTVVSCVQVWRTLTWFNWSVIATVQIPMALLWSLFTNTRILNREKDELQITLTRTLQEVEETKRQREAARADTPAPAPAQPGSAPVPAVNASLPRIADHTLIKRVGKGGYGEVWLARNAVGLHHVIKIVHRSNFNDDGPYEREFRGIQKFMPISRSHPGFVCILHVGRDDQEGFFHYVMEAGDDEKTGQSYDPANYTPKNLGSELRRGGALRALECIELGIALAEALQKLHEQNLIHRDIKPANIIYVDSRPKLADIGLVTEIQSTDADVSRLGTDGFMAPEGPGTPASDVYSLGKVLYEACMGLDRRRFPELPTALYESPDSDERMMLNRVILKACEPRPEDRYPGAAEMRDDLLKLRPGYVGG